MRFSISITAAMFAVILSMPAQAKEPLNPVDYILLDSVKLIDPEKTFAENLPVESMNAYVKNIHGVVIEAVQVPAWDSQILIQVRLSKDRPPVFEIVHQGGPLDSVIQGIYRGLDRLPDLRSKSEALAFQTRFKIKKPASWE